MSSQYKNVVVFFSNSDEFVPIKGTPIHTHARSVNKNNDTPLRGLQNVKPYMREKSYDVFPADINVYFHTLANMYSCKYVRDNQCCRRRYVSSFFFRGKKRLKQSSRLSEKNQFESCSPQITCT